MSDIANFVFDVSKGRVAEFCTRVVENDPAGCALLVCLLASTGLEAQSVLQGDLSFAAVVAGSTNESTNTGYARKVLATGSIGPFAPDTVNHNFPCDIPDQTWTAVSDDGTGPIGALLIAYRPATSSVDSAILPMTHHTFAVTPDGSDITAQIALGGFYLAS